MQGAQKRGLLYTTLFHHHNTVAYGINNNKNLQIQINNNTRKN